MDLLSQESRFSSIKPMVEFLDIEELYNYNDDLIFTYNLNDYIPQQGDRIAIYVLGWNYVKDYFIFEWVPTGVEGNMQSITFPKYGLPLNVEKLYQVCYISGENELHGASTPFQFYSKCIDNVPKTLSTNTTTNKQKCTLIERKKDLEIAKLKEENAMLKEALQAILTQKSGNCPKNYDEIIKELRTETVDLHCLIHTIQNQVEALNTKMKQGFDDCKNVTLEECRKLINCKQSLKPDCIESDFVIGELKSFPPFPFAK